MARAGRLSFSFALLAAFCAAAGLSACRSTVAGDPARAVEQYLQARVDRNADAVRRLLCSGLEDQYETEITTFEGVDGARIDNMACGRVEGAGDADDAVVRCEGRIMADYGAESNEFPLASYRVKQENGEWRWCGEQAP